MTAVEYERDEAAELLLKHGALPKAQNKLQHNALEIADWYGHKNLVAKLTKVYGEQEKPADGAAAASGAGAPAAASSSASTGGDTPMAAERDMGSRVAAAAAHMADTQNDGDSAT